MKKVLLAIVTISLLTSCGGPAADSHTQSVDSQSFRQEAARSVLIGPADRPAPLKFPRRTSDIAEPLPLVVLLHGRGNSAKITDFYLGLSRNQRRLGYALLLPDGRIRGDGQRIWNATDECCADASDTVNDSKYIQDLVAEAVDSPAIDRTQVFVLGHSNGGFMAYRLACDSEGLFRGIVTIAASTFASEQQCQTTTPLSVLAMHGTDDDVVPYLATGKRYPSAPETARRWAQRNNCQQHTRTPLARNLLFLTIEPGFDANGRIKVSGNPLAFSLKPETDEDRYDHCDDGTKTGLWTINGAGHAPLFQGRDVIRKALEFVGFQPR